MFDCNFNREQGKSHQCVQFIASPSANRLGLLIAIPSVKFKKKKKEKELALMPLLKWAVASTHFPWQDMLLMGGL